MLRETPVRIKECPEEGNYNNKRSGGNNRWKEGREVLAAMYCNETSEQIRRIIFFQSSGFPLCIMIVWITLMVQGG